MSVTKTTGQLRDLLLSVMEEVKSGKLNYDKANAVIKGASQVNESIYAELKAKQLAKELGGERHKLGAMPLTDD
jgi:hypothetical protein